MMNKKAIAAFAAGATLLAGFAMATPAFAADAEAPTQATIYAELDKEATKLEKEATTAETTAKDSEAAYKKALGEHTYDYYQALLDKDENDATAKPVKEAKTKAETDRKAADTKKAAAVAARQKADVLKPKPVEPSKDAKRVALAKLDEAQEKLGKAKEAKDKAFAEADAAFNAKHEAENNVKAAERARDDYESNAKDKGSNAYQAEFARLKKVVNEANEAKGAAEAKFTDANKAFVEAAGKFNDALGEYTRAYKNAQP